MQKLLIATLTFFLNKAFAEVETRNVSPTLFYRPILCIAQKLLSATSNILLISSPKRPKDKQFSLFTKKKLAYPVHFPTPAPFFEEMHSGPKNWTLRVANLAKIDIFWLFSLL